MTGPIDFYFDYLSPYSYLALGPVRELCERRGIELRPRPILLAGLLSHYGQLGPAEIPPKREFTFKDVVRRAHDQGLPMKGPASHPFRPLTALRVSLPQVAGDRQLEVIEALFSAGWGHGLELGDPDAIARALDQAGLDGQALVARAMEDEVKEALRIETDEALRRGVFGVPTFVVEAELFWGQDRLSDLERWLDGEDPIDERGLRAFLAIPSSARRGR